MKQGEYRAWMEGIREEYLIEAADYKPERRAVPIWYTVGITSAVAAIAVCVGLIAYRGRNPEITDPNGIAAASSTAAATSVSTSETAAESNTMVEVVTGTNSNTEVQNVEGELNYFGGHGAISVLSESDSLSLYSIAKDNEYYYLPNGSDLKIPLGMINTPHSGTLGYESFVNPFSNSSTGGRLLSLYDAYGYYTQEDGVLYQVQNDGTEKKIADIRTFDIDPASTAEPDFTGKAKGILTQTDIEKAFHINDHVMYIQYRETGTYQEPNDINILYGFFFDTITNTETPIYPVINDDDTAAYFSSSVGSLNAAKVHGKDAVFFTMGGSSGVVVDTDGHYYKINLESNRKFNSYYCVKGDVIYYQAGASEWCSYNYVTGEQAIVSTPDASITMISISANGERVWFFGDDSKLYTMNTDFTDLQLVTDQFDSRQTTMYASTDDTVFFSGAYKQNGAPIPGYYPLTTVKMANGSFIINTFGITE